MGKKITIDINGPLYGRHFNIVVNTLSEGTVGITKIFTDQNNLTHSVADNAPSYTALNLENSINTFNNLPSYFTVVRDVDKVIISVEPNNDYVGNVNVTYDLFAAPSNTFIILVEDIPIIIPDPILTAADAIPVLTRSTFSARVTPGVPFDRAELTLSLWNGDINDNPTVPTYTLTKPIVQLGQSVISFDVNYLIREKIRTSIRNYQLSGIQNTSDLDSTWIYYTMRCYNGGDSVFTQNFVGIGIYGYGYFKDGFNPNLNTRLLITGRKHIMYEGQDCKVYFLTQGLTGISIDGVAQSVAFNSNINTQYISAINLKDYVNGETMTVLFDYAGGQRETINYEIKKECKYDVINCVFINKYGFPQSLFLSKVSKHSQETESEEYRGLLSHYGSYDSTTHQYRNYNLNGRGKVICNTDNLPEAYNEVVKEMGLSEQIWLIENGVINPVILEGKNLEFKIGVNEKIIQYTLTFKYSFDTINQIG